MIRQSDVIIKAQTSAIRRMLLPCLLHRNTPRCRW